MMSLHERRCYSFNDIGILVEGELQELGVVTDVVKQPSSAVSVENRWMYVRLLSGTLGGFSPPSVLVSSTDEHLLSQFF